MSRCLGGPIQGVILSDHHESLDWRVRQAECIAALPGDALRELLQKASLLVAAGG